MQYVTFVASSGVMMCSDYVVAGDSQVAASHFTPVVVRSPSLAHYRVGADSAASTHNMRSDWQIAGERRLSRTNSMSCPRLRRAGKGRSASGERWRRRHGERVRIFCFVGTSDMIRHQGRRATLCSSPRPSGQVMSRHALCILVCGNTEIPSAVVRGAPATYATCLCT